MKSWSLLLATIVSQTLMAQNVGIGTTTPDTSALLHIYLGTSTSKGLLITGTDDPASTVPDLGAGSRMMFYPGKGAFRAGFVDGTQWDNANVGNYSFATGVNTSASGYYSTAMGYYTNASGYYSTAIGYSTNAFGLLSTAMGNGATASGSFSIAMGSGTVASGYGSVAMGQSTTSSGVGSTAMGATTVASGQFSTAMGISTIASGGFSTAMGNNTSAKSGYETVLGRFNSDYTPLNTASWDPADRLFSIGNGTSFSSRSDALVVLKNGNVGIGTTSPAATLHVNGVSLFTPGVSNIQILDGNRIQAYANGGLNLTTYSDDPIKFTTFTNGGSGSERMRILSNGNVGIGTISPAAKLHISAGDASLALFGPNTSGGSLYIGASANTGVAGTAQVIATNGNLHIDPAPGKNIYIGYYQPNTIYMNANGGDVNIGGYTQLGSAAPSIRMKKLTGTTAASQGAGVLIAHGMNSLKFISVSVMVEYSPGYWVGPNDIVPAGPGDNFIWDITPTNIQIWNTAGNSVSILSKPIIILITYEE